MLGIVNGRVYDPINGVNGEVRDVWMKDGRIVAPDDVDRERAETIDATGMVVMPGGVDIHSHFAGAKVNAGRKFRPEDHRGHSASHLGGRTRSGAGYTTPTTHMTGYMYAEMGYTTVMEAATAPLVARHTHEELPPAASIEPDTDGDGSWAVRHKYPRCRMNGSLAGAPTWRS